MDAMEMAPSPRSLPPSPRLSNAITRCFSDNRWISSPQSPIAPEVPMISSSGSPSPLIS